jgi:ABC-type nitrate/sulfonate/bicarbonate transport system permease component
LNGSIFTILLISITATAAVLWEFMEFTGDQLFHTNIQVSLANTMQDQFMGLLGGLTLAFLYWRRQVLQNN